MAGKLNSTDSGELTAIADINITPFVDVVLVLLVIFMVTAPMLVREQMNVNLPKASSGEKSASESISLIIDKTGQIKLMNHVILANALEAAVKDLLLKNPNAQAVISADQDTKHGDVIGVMDLVKKAGVTRFAIQIEQQSR